MSSYINVPVNERRECVREYKQRCFEKKKKISESTHLLGRCEVSAGKRS